MTMIQGNKRDLNLPLDKFFLLKSNRRAPCTSRENVLYCHSQHLSASRAPNISLSCVVCAPDPRARSQSVRGRIHHDLAVTAKRLSFTSNSPSHDNRKEPSSSSRAAAAVARCCPLDCAMAVSAGRRGWTGLALCAVGVLLAICFTSRTATAAAVSKKV